MNDHIEAHINKSDYTSRNFGGDTSRNTNRHRSRELYISPKGSWQIKASVCAYSHLRDITGILEIFNYNSNNFLNDITSDKQNKMKGIKDYCKTGTRLIDQEINKLDQTNETLSLLSTSGSLGKCSLSKRKEVNDSSLAGIENSEKNYTKNRQLLSPDKTITKFIFKDLRPKFDPSWDIIESTITNKSNFGSECSSTSKKESSPKTNYDPDCMLNKTSIRKIKKKRRIKACKDGEKTNKKYKYVKNKTKLSTLITVDKLHSPPKKRQLGDIEAENISVLEQICSGTIDEATAEKMEDENMQSKSNTGTSEKTPLFEYPDQTISLNGVVRRNLTMQQNMLIGEENQGKMDGKDNIAGDLNTEMKRVQVTEINRNKDKKQDLKSNTSEEKWLVNKSQEQIKRENTKNLFVDNKIESDYLGTTVNSSEHKVKLKTNSSQKVKRNSLIKKSRKQIKAIDTSTLLEKDECHKQADEEDKSVTNLATHLLLKEVVTHQSDKSHRKEKLNSTKDIQIECNSSGSKTQEQIDRRSNDLSNLSKELNTSQNSLVVNSIPKKDEWQANTNVLIERSSAFDMVQELTEHKKLNISNFNKIDRAINNSTNVFVESKETDRNNTDTTKMKAAENIISRQSTNINSENTYLKAADCVSAREITNHKDKFKNNTGTGAQDQSWSKDLQKTFGNGSNIKNAQTEIKTDDASFRKCKKHKAEPKNSAETGAQGQSLSEELKITSRTNINNPHSDKKTTEYVSHRKSKKHKDKSNKYSGTDVQDQFLSGEKHEVVNNDTNTNKRCNNMKPEENVTCRNSQKHTETTLGTKTYFTDKEFESISEELNEIIGGDFIPEKHITPIKSTKPKKVKCKNQTRTDSEITFPSSVMDSDSDGSENLFVLTQELKKDLKPQANIHLARKELDLNSLDTSLETVINVTSKNITPMINTSENEQLNSDKNVKSVFDKLDDSDCINISNSAKKHKRSCSSNTEIGLSSKTPAKKQKLLLHEKIERFEVSNFKGKTSLSDPGAQIGVSPSKKNKRPYKSGTIGNHSKKLACPDKICLIPSNKLNNRDTNDPDDQDCVPQDESKTGSNSSSEIEDTDDMNEKRSSLQMPLKNITPTKNTSEKEQMNSDKYETSAFEKHDDSDCITISNSAKKVKDSCSSNTEIDVGSNISDTKANKLKKHHHGVERYEVYNFESMSSWNSPEPPKDASPQKKNKRPDEKKTKGNHKKKISSPDEMFSISSNELKNRNTNDPDDPDLVPEDESNTNDPEDPDLVPQDESNANDPDDPDFVPQDESVMSATSSLEIEDTDGTSQKRIKKSQKQSKVSLNCSSSKNRLVLVSSTPYPAKKKEKKNVSKQAENFTGSFKNSSLGKTLNSSSDTNQTILEDIQCQMIASESELEKLRKIDIDIDWDLSPLHKIDSGSCKVNMAKLKEKLGTKHSRLVNCSKFTKEEESEIQKSWNEFAEMYGFDNPELFFPSRQNFGYFPYGQRHKFKLYLAKYLPDRRLFSVYSKFVDIYGVKSKGRWSKQEDRLLLELYFAYNESMSIEGEDREESQRSVKYGLTMKKIMQKALNRTLPSIEARLKILLENEHARSLSQKDIIWTPELEGALVHNLLKKSRVKSLEELRDATIPYKVWHKVVTKLELPLDKVLNQWKYHLYPQLFARQPVLRHVLQIELIKWFYNSGIRDSKSIDWADLSRRSGDLGSCNLYRIFRTLIGNFVPKESSKNFRDSVTFLHEYYIPILKEKKSSLMLTRKVYDPHTRTLKCRDEDEKDCLPFRIQ